MTDEESDDPLAELDPDADLLDDDESDDRDLETLFEEEFTEVDSAEVAPDDVWTELESVGAEEEPEVTSGTPTVRVIPKRICHGCRYFDDPPDTRCTHEGTEIREQVDMDHFEVVDCPVVAAREDLGQPREEYD